VVSRARKRIVKAPRRRKFTRTGARGKKISKFKPKRLKPPKLKKSIARGSVRIPSAGRLTPRSKSRLERIVKKKSKREKPTRIEVVQPRSGKTITVSSRSRLVRAGGLPSRRREPDIFRTGARGRQVKVPRKGRGRGSPPLRSPPRDVFAILGGQIPVRPVARTVARPILRAGTKVATRRQIAQARGRPVPPDQLGFFSGGVRPQRTTRRFGTDFDVLF
jgi:hypothetical protein